MATFAIFLAEVVGLLIGEDYGLVSFDLFDVSGY